MVHLSADLSNTAPKVNSGYRNHIRGNDMANLLHKALKGSDKITLTVVKMPEPKLVDLDVADIGPCKVGDALELCVTCIVKSISPEGVATVNIIKAEPEEEEVETEDKPMMVRNQTEPMPG